MDAFKSKMAYRRTNAIPMHLVFKKFDVEYPEHLGHISCPFPHHRDDHTPSFKFYKMTNSFCCFGCQAAGGSIYFVRFMLGISVEEAIEWLVKEFDIKVDSGIENILDLRERILNRLNFSDTLPHFQVEALLQSFLTLFKQIKDLRLTDPELVLERDRFLENIENEECELRLLLMKSNINPAQYEVLLSRMSLCLERLKEKVSVLDVISPSMLETLL